jgi:outer membrane protein OmpA-like peptidoglycan-associated protein
MALSPFRFARLLAAGAALLLVLAPAARAVDERGWISLEVGGNFYDPEQGFRDGAGFGLRGTGFLNRWLGVEGLASFSSPSTESSPNSSNKFSHFGADLLFTPNRNEWIIPYFYGGVGATHASYGGGPSKTKGALHGGAGILLRTGERFGIKLDAQDVSYSQEGGPGRDARVNVMELRAGVAASWFGRPRDTDADGVPDKVDHCPGTPKGAVVDASGCPIDSDGDGVYDGLDKCAGTPKGARVDADGCPIDSDGDGVFDGIDRCPETPKGVVVDAVGCPVDSDGDGAFDGPDKCPDTPKGAKVDANGCPIDSDGDGIPDGIDTCPYTPAGEAVNAGGCPITPSYYERQLLEGWLMTLTDLEFAPDSARILPQGVARLDSIGVVLCQWPMLKVEIGVHSDNEGEVDHRFQLTRFRGRAVQQYLLAKFPMLTAKNYWFTGYGDSDPLAPNTTAAGRAMNRRVEFKLVDMHELVKERDRRTSLGSNPAPPAPGLEPKMPSPAPEQVPPQGQAPQGGTTPEKK